MECFSSLASVGAHSSGLKDVISLEQLLVENQPESWISRVKEMDLKYPSMKNLEKFPVCTRDSSSQIVEWKTEPLTKMLSGSITLKKAIAANDGLEREKNFTCNRAKLSLQ